MKRYFPCFRVPLFLLLAAWIPFCWLTFQAVHELGHVLTAVGAGTEVEKVVLSPWTFSRTETAFSPHRTWILWGGAVGGCVIPVIFWLCWKFFRMPAEFLFRFWAGFCLIANGAYFGADFSTVGPTDAGELYALGTPRFALVIFGISAVSAGLFLWNGLGCFWGLGKTPQKIEKSAILIAWSAFLAVFLAEIIGCTVF
ncbi:MAG: hypothetical protein IJD43_01030 [Thermoguttaceae bacterium]|nr:hypothetical protein [Planctomycetaceae bacterium]MBQ4142043.1 hypothetical protein [Thermoguttaceae bacterium]